MAATLNKTYSFGEFELDADRRVLLKSGEPVHMRSKTLEVLLVLIENNGELVSREELLERVWKNQFIEENNLSVHIAALRKVFGESRNENRYIATVPGSGYRFVAPINTADRQVVIESHAIHRVVIDSETSTEVVPSTLPAPIRRFPRSFLLTIVPVLAVLVAIAWALMPGDAQPPASLAVAVTARTFPIAAGIPQRVALSPDGKTVGYARRLKGKDSLWISDAVSGSTVQITEDSYRLHDAIEFSPDGRTIYFTGKDDTHRDWTLMSIPTLGGAVRDMITGIKGGIGVSHDGRNIAYFKSGSGPDSIALYVADADGKQERLVLHPKGERKFVSSNLSWSPTEGSVTVMLSDQSGKGCSFANVDPTSGATKFFGEELCSGVANFAWTGDGSSIFATERSEVSGELSRVTMIDLRSGAKSVLTDGSNRYVARSLSVSTDGTIAVLEIRNYPEISKIGSDGSATSILQSSAQAEGAYGLVIAPDGRLVYTMRTAGARAIWEMSVDGSGQRELIAPQAGKEDVQVAVSPDNRFIVFESNRSGSSELWRANRDGSNLLMLTSGGGNSEPEISPNGKLILYSSLRDGKQNIWQIPIEGGPAIQLTYDGCSWPDISPDGKYFACATGVTTDGAMRRVMVYPIDDGSPIHSLAIATSSILYNRLRWSVDGRAIVYKDIAEGLWRQDIDGGEPVRISGLDDIRIFHFRFLPDGSLLYSGGPQKRSIVLLEKAAHPTQ